MNEQADIVMEWSREALDAFVAAWNRSDVRTEDGSHRLLLKLIEWPGRALFTVESIDLPF